MASGNNLALASPPETCPIIHDNSSIRRTDFPQTFIFGAGTAAYQVEGAAAVGGKGPCLWDDVALNTPSKIADGSNGNVACDMYHRYEEDIVMMKNMGFDGYRFSISWSRILPTGRASGGVNREGIDYYNKLIDFVIKNGMKPYVTLFHFDTPIWLEKEYGGFLSKKIVDDFRDYVELCFWEFGDRVKWWTTVNEPYTYVFNGYVNGLYLPLNSPIPIPLGSNNIPSRLCNPILKKPTPKTPAYSEFVNYDPRKGPYYVAKHLLLAHAAAVHLYRNKFQEVQEGQIGIVLNSDWHVPFDENCPEDRAAVTRGIDFMLGWFLEPVLYGKYPDSMIEFVPPENLAHLSQHESQMLKGTIDYLGLNYYTTSYVQYNPNPDPKVVGVGYLADRKINLTFEKNNVPIGEKSGSDWLYVVPWGIYEHLVYLKNHYKCLPPIYITENGYSDASNPDHTAKEACVDTIRVRYHQDHLANIYKAMNENHVDVRGYFVWSFCDNYEWGYGYTVRFGLVYIDFINNLTRYPKDSAKWFIKFLKAKKYVAAASSKRQAIEVGADQNKASKKARAVTVEEDE